MSDTHEVTETDYVVVVTERVIDCDGACVIGEGLGPPTNVHWANLPPRLLEAMERWSGMAFPPPDRRP